MKFFAKISLWCLKWSDEKTKREILRLAVKDLFKAIDVEDILRRNPDGTWRFEDKTLDASYMKDLKTQADMLDKLLLWKVLKKDIEYQIRKKMFEEARIDLDVVWSQLLTFLWDTIQTRLQILRQ